MTLPYFYPNYPNYVPGADSSSWEDISSTPQIPDFPKANSLGWRFNYLRASFGKYYRDKCFVRDWANCRKTPMLLGAYHFLVWEQSPEEQAQFFWNIVKDDPGELPLICDFEWWNTIPSNAFDLLYRFLEDLKKLTTKKIGIYTATGFWNQYGKKDAYWSQYIIWLAHYNNTAPLYADVPMPWKKCDFWQFTGKGPGNYYGMESKDVDLDFYMGTEDELKALCGITGEITPPNGDDNDDGDIKPMIKMKVQKPVLNIRSGPGINYYVVSVLRQGDEVTVYDVAGKNSAWVKISETEEKWSCVQDANNLYLKKVQ